MALGPGRYDDLATRVRKLAHARAVVVIVIEGDKGSGFSVQTAPEIVLSLPTLLRTVANDIEEAEGKA